MLAREDLYASKLLANADRGLDTSTLSRDIIDLAMMIRGWGPIPEPAWHKAHAGYGQAIDDYFDKAKQLLTDAGHLRRCLDGLQMDPDLAPVVLDSTQDAASPE